MDYQTALNWVNALNSYNAGEGWLNHHNWQLPTNPGVDKTCTQMNGDNFGGLCSGDAMGSVLCDGLLSCPNYDPIGANKKATLAGGLFLFTAY